MKRQHDSSLYFPLTHAGFNLWSCIILSLTAGLLCLSEQEKGDAISHPGPENLCNTMTSPRIICLKRERPDSPGQGRKVLTATDWEAHAEWGRTEGERVAIPSHEFRVSSVFNNATMWSSTWILCFCAFRPSEKIHISFQSSWKFVPTLAGSRRGFAL